MSDTVTVKQQYIDLAERCEAAEAGSRELDAEIALVVGWEHRSGQPWSKVLEWEKPAYTTSLDAAMTLLPENTRCRCQIMEDGRAAAVIWSVVGEQPADPWMQLRATPALALLAAICRAMGEG